jgi:hypothetical protein
MTQLLNYDHNTGETIVRDLTADELLVKTKEETKFNELAEAKAAAIAQAQAKLAALGLTADDLKALGL